MRQNRVQPPETTFHVTAHGNGENEPIFVDDRDRQRFLQTLAETTTRFVWDVRAYCLMDTHYHLLVHTPELTLARGMARLNGIHAQTFNFRHRRRGHLFRDRYWSAPLLTDEHLLLALRYIARNPVAAGLCETADEWRWSSHRAISGVDTPPVWLRIGPTHQLFGGDGLEAAASYASFVAAEL
jgi:REP element-mobilizing transposase RayT